MGPFIRWYGRFLARYFYVVILITSFVCATLLTTALLFATEPDFSNPDLGFETRGTDLARRVVTWRNLEEAVKQSTILSSRPTGFREPTNRNRTTSARNATTRRERRDTTAKNLSRKDQQYFCGEPGPDFSRVVVRAKSPSGLFNAESLKELCELGDILVSAPSLKQICQYSNSEETQCCPPWSLGSYVAELRSTKCSNLTETDVSAVLDLLTLCLPHFTSGKLLVCAEGPCDKVVPERCSKNNYVFDILYYLTDSGFMRASNATLHYSVLFLPVATSTETSDFFFEALSGRDFEQFQSIQLVGAELGLKWWLFEFYLLRDTIICVGLASVAVFFCLWAYSGSFSLSFSTMTSGAMSLAIAYFFYSIVFSIDFFPYINLMAVALAMAMVADDSFIVWAAWKTSKRHNGQGEEVEVLVSEAIAESWLPCTVTSLTTAGALYSSFVSSITAVKCFSVFAGTAVVVNLFLTLTWLPAWLVFDEKLSKRLCGREESKVSVHERRKVFKVPANFFAKVVDYFFVKILPAVLVKCRFAWIIIFGLLTTASVLAVTYYPGLRLPHSSEFQLFDLNHPFERYSFVLKKFLPFEEEEEKYSASLPLRFVWGIEATDSGNHLDPNDWGRGAVSLDQTFNMSSPESQVFLLDFCQDLRQQNFYLETPGAMIPNCFIESFKNYFMGRDCIDEIERVNLWPCCQDTRFPYKPKIFDNCIAEGVGSLYAAQNKFFGTTPAGPKFVHGTEPPQIGVVVVEYSSVYNFTFDHGEMNQFYSQVQSWFEEKSREAPDGMKNGWFVSDLEFYDLQTSLSTDTYLTIATDMGIAFVVLFLTTQELLLSILAILTVSSVIFSTVAVLTIFGWTLNILESAIVTLAIGLAVDFALHYGIAYKTARGVTRRDKVEAAVKSVGVPVAMGALTTFLAGLAMLPSRVLAHVQIGIFLVVLMATSWALSTFFLVPLLAAFGSVGTSCCNKKTESRGVEDRAEGSESPVDLNSISELDQTFESFTLRPAIVPQSHLVLGKTTRV
jgi:hypothetical protein